MNKQFTASEVRNEASNHWRLSDGPQQTLAGKMLRAFADRLEADEKAVPVAWTLIFEKSIGVNATTTFKHREDAEDYANACAMPDKCNPFPQRLTVVPLYAHPSPSDADRLAEALRKIVDIDYVKRCCNNGIEVHYPDAPPEMECCGDPDVDFGPFAQIAMDALAAHDAQAQTPAASVKQHGVTGPQPLHEETT